MGPNALRNKFAGFLFSTFFGQELVKYLQNLHSKNKLTGKTVVTGLQFESNSEFVVFRGYYGNAEWHHATYLSGSNFQEMF